MKSYVEAPIMPCNHAENPMNPTLYTWLTDGLVGGAVAVVIPAVAAAVELVVEPRVKALGVGGVGLELMCTPGTLATLRVGSTAMLPTSMVVREDSLTVFGVLDDPQASHESAVRLQQQGTLANRIVEVDHAQTARPDLPVFPLR